MTSVCRGAAFGVTGTPTPNATTLSMPMSSTQRLKLLCCFCSSDCILLLSLLDNNPAAVRYPDVRIVGNAASRTAKTKGRHRLAPRHLQLFSLQEGFRTVEQRGIGGAVGVGTIATSHPQLGIPALQRIVIPALSGTKSPVINRENLRAHGALVWFKSANRSRRLDIKVALVVFHPPIRRFFE